MPLSRISTWLLLTDAGSARMVSGDHRLADCCGSTPVMRLSTSPRSRPPNRAISSWENTLTTPAAPASDWGNLDGVSTGSDISASSGSSNRSVVACTRQDWPSNNSATGKRRGIAGLLPEVSHQYRQAGAVIPPANVRVPGSAHSLPVDRPDAARHPCLRRHAVAEPWRLPVGGPSSLRLADAPLFLAVFRPLVDHPGGAHPN